MPLARTLLLLAAVPFADDARAQLVTGAQFGPKHFIDLTAGTSETLPPLASVGCQGLATDELTSTLYMIGNAPLESLYRWDYPDGDSVTPIGLLAPFGASGSGGSVDGLAFGNGRLYAMVGNAFTSAPAGIYEVDVQSGDMTPVLTSTVGPFFGLAYDESTGLFYAPNSSLNELCVLDPVTQTITPIPGSDYSPFNVAFEGCTFSNGRLYLIGASPGQPGRIFDLATSTWVGLFANPNTTAGSNGAGIAYSDTFGDDPIVNYCAANPNSTGAAAVMGSSGSRSVAANDLVLEASSLPSFSFAFFVVSRDQGFVANPGGSSGNLCLSGAIGRYVGPGQIQQSGNAGTIALPIDVTAVPQPNGFVGAVPGETWNFQAWFRDTGPGGATSNFTDGLSVRFR